jgi:hypothetical protein
MVVLTGECMGGIRQSTTDLEKSWPKIPARLGKLPSNSK